MSKAVTLGALVMIIHLGGCSIEKIGFTLNSSAALTVTVSVVSFVYSSGSYPSAVCGNKGDCEDMQTGTGLYQCSVLTAMVNTLRTSWTRRIIQKVGGKGGAV